MLDWSDEGGPNMAANAIYAELHATIRDIVAEVLLTPLRLCATSRSEAAFLVHVARSTQFRSLQGRHLL